MGPRTAPSINLCRWRAFGSDEISRSSISRQGAVQFFLCSTRCCQRTLSRDQLRAKCVRSCSGTRGRLGRQPVNVIPTPAALCLALCDMAPCLLLALPFKSTPVWHIWACPHILGFPGGSVVQNPSANARDEGWIPGVRKLPWRRKWQPIPVCLPGKSHGQRNLVGYSSWGRRSQTRPSN